MSAMVKRNLKIYFRDKASVFFSMLSVIIIFALYILFIGDSVNSGLKFLPHPNRLMRAWMLAGMLASASITTSLGAYGVIISDRENKAIKDFYSSPVSRRQVAGGYIVTGFIISIIMSIFTLIFGEIYLGLAGGAVLDIETLLKLFAVIVLSAFASSAIASFMISFLKTNSSYSAASTIVGTLIGFLVGAYIPNRQLARQRSVAGKVLPMCSFSGTLPAAFDEACNKGKFCQSAGKCTKRDQGNVWDCLRL